MKIWCEKCKGTREQLNQNPFNVIRRLCPECDGKGYTEHEGNLEDLELGLATKEFFSQDVERRSMALEANNMGKVIAFNVEELLDWYRDQKVVHNDTRTENAATPEKCE